MSWWARVVSGVVAEPAAQLPDGDAPSDYFPSTLSGTWYPSPDGSPQSGWTFDGTTYTPPSSTPTLPQQAQVALGAGIQIVSTATPSLNGTYPIDLVSQSKVRDADVYILKNSTFYSGATTYPWIDMSGTPHTFGLSDFDNFATAVANYVAALDLIVAGGPGPLPSSIVTIP